ncbi:hypothetical protein CYMTET_23723 [Cymbomonas tetramitiformis]|uniref:Uncharacterized protein n=1 Tax=Cymbomonas tetramitiformis TaxID=36881 RepID=A0AAE0L0Z6_9CHLO|nr:hypothetical protein CYMTET_23723 [Cymbomonas tetramitiformis]
MSEQNEQVPSTSTAPSRQGNAGSSGYGRTPSQNQLQEDELLANRLQRQLMAEDSAGTDPWAAVFPATDHHPRNTLGYPEYGEARPASHSRPASRQYGAQESGLSSRTAANAIDNPLDEWQASISSGVQSWQNATSWFKNQITEIGAKLTEEFAVDDEHGGQDNREGLVLGAEARRGAPEGVVFHATSREGLRRVGAQVRVTETVDSDQRPAASAEETTEDQEEPSWFGDDKKKNN